MKYLGIDYGTKRIGLATSDDEGKLAFPNAVIENSANKKDAILKIKEVIESEGVGAIVMGESKDLKMKDNPIMEEIRGFAKGLEEEVGIEVKFFSELFTSSQVATEEHFAKTPREQNVRGEKRPENLDARAASLMLQGYLDSQK